MTALFKKKSTETKASPTEIKEKESANGVKTKAVYVDVFAVLHRPRITEKATFATDRDVYVFEIAPNANKKDVARAVKEIYNVTPIKVNIAAIPYKRIDSFVRKRRGTKGGGKKAYVYLRKGDRIELI